MRRSLCYRWEDLQHKPEKGQWEYFKVSCLLSFVLPRPAWPRRASLVLGFPTQQHQTSFIPSCHPTEHAELMSLLLGTYRCQHPRVCQAQIRRKPSSASLARSGPSIYPPTLDVLVPPTQQYCNRLVAEASRLRRKRKASKSTASMESGGEGLAAKSDQCGAEPRLAHICSPMFVSNNRSQCVTFDPEVRSCRSHET